MEEHNHGNIVPIVMEKEMQDVVEQFKTVKSFAQDYIEYCRSREVVQNYVRSDAIILIVSTRL